MQKTWKAWKGQGKRGEHVHIGPIFIVPDCWLHCILLLKGFVKTKALSDANTVTSLCLNIVCLHESQSVLIASFSPCKTNTFPEFSNCATFQNLLIFLFLSMRNTFHKYRFNEKVISNVSRLLDLEYQCTNRDFSFPFGVHVSQQGSIGLLSLLQPGFLKSRVLTNSVSKICSVDYRSRDRLHNLKFNVYLKSGTPKCQSLIQHRYY